MRTDLALQNISHNKRRAALSIAGISIAIVLIFMQLGFRGAVANTATMIYARMDFDLMLSSPDYLHFVVPGQIPRHVLDQTSSRPDIKSVSPFHVSMVNWDVPSHSEGSKSEESRIIVVMGIEPSAPTFHANERKVVQDLGKLSHTNFVLIDQKSFKEYGPVNGKRFTDKDIGVTTTVGGKPVTIAGLFEMGSGLTANGALLVTEQGFDRLLPFDSYNNVSMGLIKYADGLSSTQKTSIQKELQDQFRLDKNSVEVEVLTRQQVLDRELHRWLNDTPIGFIFFMGVVISMLVGAAIVYMVLSNDVARKISEYATLKAMGYSNWFLAAVVLRQAVYLSIIAYVPSLIVSLTLYWITATVAQIPIFMTLERVFLVFGLSLLMSTVSGALAIKKLWQAQPADLF